MLWLLEQLLLIVEYVIGGAVLIAVLGAAFGALAMLAAFPFYAAYRLAMTGWAFLRRSGVK